MMKLKPSLTICAVQDAELQAEPPQIGPEWQSSSLSDHEDK